MTKTPSCNHQWIVWCTALVPPTIELYCKICRQYATVKDHTSGEWRDAFYAPSNPYPWHDLSRVVEREGVYV
jgi:hypothetical protein